MGSLSHKSNLITWGDVYGDQSEKFAGNEVPTSGANASGSGELEKVGNAGTNQSFSWLVFFGILVAIRVLESLAK